MGCLLNPVLSAHSAPCLQVVQHYFVADGAGFGALAAAPPLDATAL